MDRKEAYRKKLLDPRWQKQRLKILERDEWTCQMCFDSENTLHVHHRYYEKGFEPWEYADEALVALCADCHAEETAARPEAEATLIRSLRERLFASDVMDLAEVLADLPDLEMTLSALRQCVPDDDLRRGFINAYMARLGEQ